HSFDAIFLAKIEFGHCPLFPSSALAYKKNRHCCRPVSVGRVRNSPQAVATSSTFASADKFVYCFGNGGQAFQTEDCRSRIHFAPDRRHGEIRSKRANARRADRERNRAGDGRITPG